MSNDKSRDAEVHDYFLVVSRSKAKQLLQKLINDGDNLSTRCDNIDTIKQLSSLIDDFDLWYDFCQYVLRHIFSNDAPSLRILGARLDDAREAAQPLSHCVGEIRYAVGFALQTLKSFALRIPILPAQEPNLDTSNRTRETPESVFIVHGQDEQAKLEAARTIEQLGLTPVVLHEQTNRGDTIIEKFERYSDVDFAVILLTPDDIGGKAGAETGQLKNRARQNVVLELGYFIGKLGRNRVMALRKGDTEIPSDIHGVLYERMDEGSAWKYRLARELRGAGFEVSADDIT